MNLIAKLRQSLLYRLKKLLDRFNFVQSPHLIGRNVYLSGSFITGKVTVGEGSKLYNCTLLGEVNIGRYTSVWGPNIDIHSKVYPVSIGNFCSIARNTSIQEYNHNHKRISTYYINQNVFQNGKGTDIVSSGPVEIGNDVWIGAHCVILSGVRIGDGAIIAANSVVTKDIPDYAIAAGSPAKVIKYRFSPEVIESLLKIKWWNWDLAKIRENQHLFEKELELADLQGFITE